MARRPSRLDCSGLVPREQARDVPEFAALQAAILTVLRGYGRRQPVCTNHVMEQVRSMILHQAPEDREFAELIREAAIALELVPVYFPNRDG